MIQLVVKARKIEHCICCGDNQFVIGGIHKMNRYKCKNSDAAYKSGNYRIIDRDIIYSGGIPEWCPLEDYPEKE